MLTKVVMSGFRGFAGTASFDCAGDAVILVGPNGAGKTTFFDSIQWALFGAIPRLRGSRDAVGDDYVRNRFAPEAPPEVHVYFDLAGESVVVRRRGASLAFLDSAGTESAGRTASRQVSALIRGSAGVDAAEAFDRFLLLGQDEITKFVRDTNPRDRFDSLSSLLGLDAIRRFYGSADTWLEAASLELKIIDGHVLKAERDLEQLRIQRSALQVGARQSVRMSMKGLEREFADLREMADAAGLPLGDIPVALTPSTLMAVLSGLSEQIAFREAFAEAAIQEAEELTRLTPTIGRLRRRRSELKRRTDTALTATERLETALAAARKSMEKTAAEARAVSAQLAESHREKDEFASFLLGAERWLTTEHCPVCEQPIAVDRVRKGLQRRTQEIPAAHRALARKQVTLDRQLAATRKRASDLEGDLRGARASYDSIARDLADAISRVKEWDTSSAALISEWTTAGSLAQVPRSARSALRRIGPLSKRAHQLQVQAAALRDREEVTALRREELSASRNRRTLLKERATWQRIVGSIEKLGRDAKNSEIEIVRKALDQQLPTLRAIYRRLRPHPVFDELRIEFKRFKDRGEVYYRAAQNDVSGNVSMMFSAAQLNAVAICIFMAMNMMRRPEGLDLLLMDDPIQNMDDYNVLGLVDLVRSVRGTRQVIVSTHDEQIGELLRRKLRPRSENERTILHRFLAADQSGAHVVSVTDEFVPEPTVLRLSASG